MKRAPIILLLFLASCNHDESDADQLSAMISVRERAMVEKDLEAAMSQFSEDATWINSQGYFFDGKTNILEFHQMLTGNETLDYYYEAGAPRIRMLDSSNALAYYAWKMFWYDRDSPTKIVNEEIGLMTLSARKSHGRWYWVAVTNQHTPWFYESIDNVTINADDG